MEAIYTFPKIIHLQDAIQHLEFIWNHVHSISWISMLMTNWKILLCVYNVISVGYWFVKIEACDKFLKHGKQKRINNCHQNLTS